MSDTCSLFPLLGGPWPSSLLPPEDPSFSGNRTLDSEGLGLILPVFSAEWPWRGLFSSPRNFSSAQWRSWTSGTRKAFCERGAVFSTTRRSSSLRPLPWPLGFPGGPLASIRGVSHRAPSPPRFRFRLRGQSRAPPPAPPHPGSAGGSGGQSHCWFAFHPQRVKMKDS